MRRTHRYLSIAVAAGALAGISDDARAQGQLSPSPLERGIRVDITHTVFEAFDVDLPSTVWTIAGRVPVGSRLGVNLDVPFSYASLDVGGATESGGVFGNPYVGVDFRPRSDLALEIGTRLPLNTADEESLADAIAVIADPFRLEAFIDDHVPLQVAATYSRSFAECFGIRARAGVVSLIYTGDEDEADETATAVDYGVEGTYFAGPAQLGLGVIGRWDASAEEGDFGANSFHQVAFTADIAMGPVRPGIAVRMPLDSDFRDLVTSSLGLYVRVPMP